MSIRLAPGPLFVLGLGDAARGDDGLGAVAIDQLRNTWIAPATVHIGDGEVSPGLGTGHATVLVDAIAGDDPPGAFVRLHGDHAARAIAERAPSLAARLLDGQSAALILLGLVPDTAGRHPGLSHRVAAGLEGLVRRVVLEARQLGHEFRPRAPRRPV